MNSCSSFWYRLSGCSATFQGAHLSSCESSREGTFSAPSAAKPFFLCLHVSGPVPDIGLPRAADRTPRKALHRSFLVFFFLPLCHFFSEKLLCILLFFYLRDISLHVLRPTNSWLAVLLCLHSLVLPSRIQDKTIGMNGRDSTHKGWGGCCKFVYTVYVTCLSFKLWIVCHSRIPEFEFEILLGWDLHCPVLDPWEDMYF